MLYRSIEGGEELVNVDPDITGVAPYFTYTWSDLPITDNSGKAYTYRVDEPNVPAGYDSSIDGLTVTNTYDPDKEDIVAEKIWDGGPSSDHIAVKLRLYRSVEGGEEELVDVDPDITGEAPDFTYTWSDLPMTDSSGEAYTYRVEEDEEDIPYGYVSTIAGMRVTNSYDPWTGRIRIVKSVVMGLDEVEKAQLAATALNDLFVGGALSEPLVLAEDITQEHIDLAQLLVNELSGPNARDLGNSIIDEAQRLLDEIENPELLMEGIILEPQLSIPEIPTEESVDPIKESELPTDETPETEEPVDEAEEPVDETEEPVEEPEDPSDPIEEPGDSEDPVEEPKEPVEEPEEPQDPTEEPADPSDEADEPVEPSDETKDSEDETDVAHMRIQQVAMLTMRLYTADTEVEDEESAEESEDPADVIPETENPKDSTEDLEEPIEDNEDPVEDSVEDTEDQNEKPGETDDSEEDQEEPEEDQEEPEEDQEEPIEEPEENEDQEESIEEPTEEPTEESNEEQPEDLTDELVEVVEPLPEFIITQEISIQEIIEMMLEYERLLDMEGITLEGFIFELYDNDGNLLDTAETDINGLAEFDLDLLEGNYLIKEAKKEGLSFISIIEGQQGEYSFYLGEDVVDREGYLEIKATNVITEEPPEEPDPTGRITIIKVDERTGRRLANAQFRIINSEGREVARLTTDSNGEAATGQLPYGDYEIEEASAPSGYIRIRGTIDVTIGENEENVVITIENERTPSRPDPDPDPRPEPEPEPEPDPELEPEPEPEEEVEILEEPIPEAVPEPEIEPEPELEEEVEILEEPIPQAAPILPRTGAVNPIIFTGLGAIFVGLGLFLKKKED